MFRKYLVKLSRPRRPQRALRTELLERRYMLSAEPLGDEFRVNTYTTGNQISAAAAMDATGNFVVVWQSFGQDGSLDGISGQRFDSTGLLVGEEFLINNTTTGNQQVPAVAMDTDGDFVVVWQGPGGGGQLNEIWARRYSSSGLPAGDEFLVNTTITLNQQTPAVAMDANGNFVIVWATGGGLDGSGYGIYARQYNDVGEPAPTGEFLVNTYTTNSQFAPAVAMDADGDFVVVWHSFGQVLSDDPPVIDEGLGIFAQRYNSAGEKQGGEIHANTHTTSSQRAPAVAMDADGDFLVVWESNLQDGAGYGVYAQHFNADGTPGGAECIINETTTNSQRAAAVAMDAAGNFVVTWASRGQDDASYGIYARTFNSAGGPTLGEFQVNTYTTLSQFNPTVAMDQDGDFVIAWHSGNNQDGSGYGIYAQRYGSTTNAPSVLFSNFIWEHPPQRIEIRFNVNVSASLSNADLRLENLTTTQTIPEDNVDWSYDLLSNTATFIFPGFSFGALPDGNYRATLLASGINDPGGTPLPQDYVFDFFFLMADANHDRVVNLSDFNVLAGNFGQNGRDFTQGDFTYDGLVNLVDFNQLAARFGKTIPAPPPPPFSLMRITGFGGPSRSGTSALEQLDDLQD